MEMEHENPYLQAAAKGAMVGATRATMAGVLASLEARFGVDLGQARNHLLPIIQIVMPLALMAAARNGLLPIAAEKANRLEVVCEELAVTTIAVESAAITYFLGELLRTEGVKFIDDLIANAEGVLP